MSFSSIKSMFSGAETNNAAPEAISASSAVQFHGDAETIFVDVRSLGEIMASGTVAGAIRAPLPEFSAHAVADGSSSLPAATAGMRIICVCASGARSGAAAQQLVTMGYANVANLRGGIGAWLQAGGPVER